MVFPWGREETMGTAQKATRCKRFKCLNIRIRLCQSRGIRFSIHSMSMKNGHLLKAAMEQLFTLMEGLI